MISVHKANNLRHADWSVYRGFEPGDLVELDPGQRGESRGIIVSIDADGDVYVLWAKKKPEGFVFPMVRKTFHPKILPDLVSIQPMTQPSGLLFYLDYTYGNKTEEDKGDSNV